jgi:hypothetical protein
MDQEVFFLKTVSFGHKDAFIELAPVLMGSNPKDISVTDISLDHLASLKIDISFCSSGRANFNP